MGERIRSKDQAATEKFRENLPVESAPGLERVGNSMCGYLRVEQSIQRPGVVPATGIHTGFLQKEPAILRAQRRGVLFSLEGRKPQTESPTQMLIQAKCKLVIEPWPCKSHFPRAREFKIPHNLCKLILISKEPVK